MVHLVHRQGRLVGVDSQVVHTCPGTRSVRSPSASSIWLNSPAAWPAWGTVRQTLASGSALHPVLRCLSGNRQTKSAGPRVYQTGLPLLCTGERKERPLRWNAIPSL